MGNYTFLVELDDGYQYGESTNYYILHVEVGIKLNSLPEFGEPGLEPQSFFCEEAFVYELPPVVDEDDDNVTLSLITPEDVDWIRLSDD